jgi:hypothetical protein
MSTTTKPTIGARLAAAKTALATGENLQTNLTTLQTEHDLATAEIDRLTKALAASETLANTRGTELTTASETIAAHVKTIGERDTAIKGLQTQVDGLPAKISSGVLEKAAELGIDITMMPKAKDPANAANAPETEEDYVKAISAENDPRKKKTLFIAYETKFRPALTHRAVQSAARN